METQEDDITSTLSSKVTRKKISHYLFKEDVPFHIKKGCRLYHSVSCQNNQNYIMKTFERHNFSRPSLDKFMKQNQMYIQALQNSENLVKIVDQVASTSNIYVVYEFMSCYNINQYIETPTQLSTQEINTIMQDIRIGVSEIQSLTGYQGHLRLKPENVFYDREIHQTKISDFQINYKQYFNEFITKQQIYDNLNDIQNMGLILCQTIAGKELLNMNQILFEQKLKGVPNQDNNQINFLINCVFDVSYDWGQVEQFLKSNKTKILNKRKMLSISTHPLANINETQLEDVKSINLSKNIQDVQQSNIQNSNIPTPLQSEISKNQKPENIDTQEPPSNKSKDQSQVKNIQKFDKVMNRRGTMLQTIQQKIKQQKKFKLEDWKLRFFRNKILIKINYTQTNVIELGGPDSKKNPFSKKIVKEAIKNRERSSLIHQLDIYDYKMDFKHPRYTWEVLEYIDNIPVLLNSDKIQNQNYFHNMMERQRFSFKAKDTKSNTIYIIQAITCINDYQFNKVIEEIVVNRYLQEIYTPKMYPEFIVQKIEQDNMYSVVDLANQYLGSLYEEAENIQHQKLTRNQELLDFYILRKGNVNTFILIFENYQFSLKQFLYNNSCNQQSLDQQHFENIVLFKSISRYLDQLQKGGIFYTNFSLENILIKKTNKHIQFLLSNFNECQIKKKGQNFQLDIQNQQIVKYLPPEIYDDFEINQTKKKQYIAQIFPSKLYTFIISQLMIEILARNVQTREQNLQYQVLEQDKNAFTDLILQSRHSNISDRLNLDNFYLQAVQIYQKTLPNYKNVKIYDFKKIENFHNYDQSEFDLFENLLFIKSQRKICIHSDALQSLQILYSNYEKNKLQYITCTVSNIWMMQELGNMFRDAQNIEKAVIFYKETMNLIQKIAPEQLKWLAYLNFKIGEQMMSLLSKASCLKHLNDAKLYYHEKQDKQSIAFKSRILLYEGDTYMAKKDIQIALHNYQECYLLMSKEKEDFRGYLGSNILDKIGISYYLTSEYKLALEIFSKSLDNKRHMYQEDDQEFIEIYNNLAETYRRLANFPLALIFYQKSFALLKNNDNSIQKKEMRRQLYNNMGIIYRNLNDLQTALLYYQKAMNIIEEIYPPQSDHYFENQLNIAVIKNLQGYPKAALQIYEEILNFYKSNFQTNVNFYQIALQNKGLQLYQTNDFKGAIACYNEAVKLKKQFQGNQHQSVAITLNNLGLAYYKIGKYKKSIKLFEEALEIYMKNTGIDHPESKQIQSNILQSKRFLQ